MRIARLELRNWLPYRGETSLALEGLAYGVTARRVGDERSSNWAGKSSLLAAVRFALFGSHPARTEDSWITRGEDEGSVRVGLSDGLVVERSRRKGGSTALVVRAPGTELPAPSEALFARKDAQALVERWVGLSERDFLATAFFEQKAMHRFVAARPAERFADVAAWVRLGPLREAERSARSKLAGLVDRETRLVARREATTERLLGFLGAGDPERSPAAALRAARERAEDASRAASSSAEDLARAERELEDDARARELSRAREELAAAEREAPPAPSPRLLARVVRADREASAELAAAERADRSARTLAAGGFDGFCPVAGFECPATAAINARRSENAVRREETALALADARSSADGAAAARKGAEDASRAAAASSARLETLRARVEALAALPGRLVPGAAERAAYERTNERAVARFAAEAERDARAAERDAEEVARIDAELANVRAEASTLREAARILGRAGAQRRLAAACVSAIERGANERLAAAGIDLRVALSWGRETGDLAEDCASCGAPFPPGRKTKTCPCGAERGPKVVDELGCELSSRSGAAEDLAGIALSLAAGAWVRADRLSSWGTALVDEPFGSLDEANREALARALAAMLSPAGGFEQALVVAHHEGAMDALPGRIRVTAGRHASWARVL